MDTDSLARAERVQHLRILEARITELTGHMNAASYRWLCLIEEFDRIKGWSDGATQSCAHWLNWKCGIDFGAAREKVRVAHALVKLPLIAASMQRGELSYSKVRALTRVACPKTEEYFLAIARHGTAEHVETLVRQYRRVQEVAELSREARQQAKRKIMCYHDADGSLVIKGRLPAETGAIFMKAIDTILNETPFPVSAETLKDRPTFAQQRADALGQIAESFLAHGKEALNGGDRNQIVVHVDLDTLRENVPGRCNMEHGPAMAAETARRLACDASVVSVIENEKGETLSVGRKTRSIPTALRRALNARDQGCRFPGCANKRYVDAHHIHHWAHGGETKASNLVTLCRFHHRLVHEGAARIEVLDDGALRFIQPNGEAVDSVAPGYTAPLADWQQVLEGNHRCGVRIDKNTAVTLWRGERMDNGLAIEVLLQHARRENDGSAGTSAVRRAYGNKVF